MNRQKILSLVTVAITLLFGLHLQAQTDTEKLAAQRTIFIDAVTGKTDTTNVEVPGGVVLGKSNPSRHGIASAPPAPPRFTSTTTSFTNSTPVTIPSATAAVVSSTITVTGAGPYLLDVDLTTFIMHTFNSDLDITLASPAGTVVTITTDNGSVFDNVFNGTFWDDDANPGGQVPYVSNSGLVTDAVYVDGILTSPLVPEEAMGAFVGENPNGVWTLTISDDAALDGGVLSSWSLDVTTIQDSPLTTTATFANTTPVTIPTTVSTVTSTITVSGVSNYLLDLNMATFITHSFNSDLDITLASPAGTVVTITTDNGGTLDNVFNGTVWDDDASPGGQVPYARSTGLVTDRSYSNLVLGTPNVPEEAMGAFIGENPNGVWTLTISDDAALDGGALSQWSLNIVTPLQPVMTARENISIYSRSLPSEGAIHANKSITFFQKGTHIGNLTAVENITIQKENTIQGNATAGGRISVAGTVTGVVTPSAVVSTIPLPVLSFSAGGANVIVPKNGTVVLDPGSYNVATVKKNGTLALRHDLTLGGAYFFNTLDLLELANLSIDVTNGPVDINVVNLLRFGKTAEVLISSGDAGSQQVTFNTLQTSPVELGPSAKVLGNLNAPAAQVRLLLNSAFKGAICAMRIQANQGTVFLPHGSPTSLPKAAQPDDDADDDDEITTVVTDYALAQNYPNPFSASGIFNNPSTVISFALPEAGKVTVNIYNGAGQLVRTLLEGEKPAGRHQLHWNSRNQSGKLVAAGVYLYQIVAQGKAGNTSFTQTKRMTLLK